MSEHTSDDMIAKMIKVITDHPIAILSRDYTHPHGTKNDNSINLKFNKKIQSIKPFPISVLDLGCAGGGMVKSFIDQGNFAIGLEGSDYSLKTKRVEWKTIPQNLFTADISKPFEILVDEHSIKFDLITAWELLEHIEETDLKQVFKNIDQHLSKNGIFVASINSNKEFHHRTAKPKEWWLERIAQTNLELDEEMLSSFEPNEFVRVDIASTYIICKKRGFKA